MSKKCKQDEILNPLTNRCVKKSGKIGKELLKGRSKSLPKQKVKTGKKQTLGNYCDDGIDCNTGCCITNKCSPKAKCKAKAYPVSYTVPRPKTLPRLDLTMFKNLNPEPAEYFTIDHDPRGYDGGTATSTNIMANYLTIRNPNLCFVFNKDSDIDIANIHEIDKWWICITVINNNAYLRNNTSQLSKLTHDCLKRNNRFLGFIVYLDYPAQKNAHCNMLVYDRKEQTLELFEPHGDMHIHNSKTKADIDNIITNIFYKSLNIRVKKYYKPLDFCPRESIQLLQDRQMVQQNLSDTRNIGFCTYWSFWWIELRARNPDIPNRTLINLAISELKSHPESMTDFIHKFAVFVTRVINNMGNNNTPKQLAKVVARKLDMYAGSK